ncbi:MAG: beta-ketoacyl synthase [Candidatus Korobacteraceae bacterium]
MSLHMRRVAITGIGVICALGHNLQETWDALRSGRCGIGPLQSMDGAALRFCNAAEVRGYDEAVHLDRSRAASTDRFAQFAIIAAREALRQSGLEFSPRLCARTAVVTGSAVGGKGSEDAQFLEVYGKNGRVHPLTVPRAMANAGTSAICMELGVTGPAFTLSTACASSNHALGQAFWMVRNGVVEAAIAGGSEAPFSYVHLKAWEAMRVVAPNTCRPFSRDRQGMVLGEGAAMLLLEPLDAAKARGAAILGEIVGFGMSSDASHITHPSVEGPEQAMRAALEDASLAPEAVGYINAHGTGTIINDRVETQAIHKLFESHAGKLAVSSTKSMHGHALGAAGALEAVATVMALKQGLLPPTVNFSQPDPECDLDVIPNQPRETQMEYALSNSFAFGGLNAVLAFRR